MSGPRTPSPRDVAVVVPTYRRPDRMAAIMGALEAQTMTTDHFEVIVVDDCSADGTAAIVRGLAEGSPLALQYLTTPANAGPAVARNTGWRATGASFLAFVDDDCLPEPGWLAAGVATLVADEHLGLVQGRTTLPPGVDVHRLDDWWLWRAVSEAGPFFEGCNIFYRRAAIEAAGGFDEDIAWWGEDTSLGWSVVDAGWGRGFADNARVVHEVARRGWLWHVRNGFLEHHVVRIAAEHPGYRREAFWRPWAFRRDDAAWAAAVAGLIVATRFRPALMAALPYLWWKRPSVRHLSFFRRCVQVPVVDAARGTGHLWGALRHRVLVL